MFGAPERLTGISARTYPESSQHYWIRNYSMVETRIAEERYFSTHAGRACPAWHELIVEGGNFCIFNYLQLNLDLQKNSKTKVEKPFFFIFMSSYAEMSFWCPKKRKSHKIGFKQIFFFE
jgi:hypothetical protein